MVVVDSLLKIPGIPSPRQETRFPVAGMVSLLLIMVLSAAGELLVASKVHLPLLHP